MKTEAHESPGRRILDRAREYLTHWSVAGGIVVLTGFGPEHWFAHVFDRLAIPESIRHGWLQAFDVRIGLVAVGIAIIAWDVLRRSAAQKQGAPLDGRPEAPAPVASPGRRGDDWKPLQATEAATPALPKMPSIAVLPFQNMSGDTEQEYFADGISEDLTTALSRFAWLFVIARNSAFTYKGRAVDVKQVGRELGVRYVLEGSVRCAGDRVRVSAQLVDAVADGCVWAEQFDRRRLDVFDLQDDIVASIAATVAPEITSAEIERARSKRPNTLNAWDRYLQAMAAYHRMTAEDIAVAISLLGQAIDLEPEFANAYALLALCHAQIGQHGWVQPVRKAYETSRRIAEKAVRVGPSSPEANHALAYVLSWVGEAERAVTVARRAIDLNPNYAEAQSVLGLALVFCGDLEGSLAACRRAQRGNPRDSRGSWLYDAMGHAYFMLGDYEQAIEVSKKGLNKDPSLYGALVTLACSYAQLGRKEEARQFVDELLRLIPRFTLRALRKHPLFVKPDLIEKLVESMRLAGLPE
jgi:adenylate cyclase